MQYIFLTFSSLFLMGAAFFMNSRPLSAIVEVIAYSVLMGAQKINWYEWERE